MSKKGQLKIIQMGPEAEQIVADGFAAGLSTAKIDMKLRERFGTGVSANAILKYKEQVLDKRLDVIEKIEALHERLMRYAPDEIKEKGEPEFSWLQKMLSGVLKMETADILLNKNIKADELLHYWDQAERRALENKTLDIKKKQLDNDHQLLVVRMQEVEAKKAAAEARLKQIESLTEVKAPMDTETAARKLREIHGLAKK